MIYDLTPVQTYGHTRLFGQTNISYLHKINTDGFTHSHDPTLTS